MSIRQEPRGRGMTLAELVLGLAITTVIGLAVTAVASAVAKINEEAEIYYEYLQTGRVAVTKVEETLRPALLVTAASNDKMVVWMKDVNDPGEINVTEVAEIYRDSASGRLLQKTTEFPDSMKETYQIKYDKTLDLADLTCLTKLDFGSGHSQYDITRVLANNVKSFEIYPDAPPPMTTLLKFKIVIGDGDQTVTHYGAAALRAPGTSRVFLKSDGKYVLN